MNIKKLLVVLVGLVLVVLLCSCGFNRYETDSAGNDNRILIIYNDGFAIIYVDTETGCQYLSRQNAGTCLMVDADGKPLLYDKED